VTAAVQPRRLAVPTPEVWGIVNVTPDSFSDGGRHATPRAAVAHGLRLLQEGADVLDVGGESTRPGSLPVPEAEEIRRVVPVIAGLREAGVKAPISVDTRRAGVARRALDAGAGIVNDVSAARDDPEMLGVVADGEAELVLMHMQGRPRDMQAAPRYDQDDVVSTVRAWLGARVEAAEAAGIPRARLWVDPGIGFGKTLEHNLDLLRGLRALTADGTRVLLGASRKSFLGLLTDRDVGDRLAASLGCVAWSAEAGIDAVRVHDVAETRDLLTVLAAVRESL